VIHLVHVLHAEVSLSLKLGSQDACTLHYSHVFLMVPVGRLCSSMKITIFGDHSLVCSQLTFMFDHVLV